MQEEIILKQFGGRLRSLRQGKGLSQEQLSERSGIDRSYISDVERGLRNIALQNINLLANALEIPIYSFFTAENDLLSRWEVSLEDLEVLINQNPSLRGFILGYLAESKLRRFFQKDKRITSLKKFDDHDRTNKSDLVIGYKGREYSVEVKSLQTSTVKKSSGKLFSNADLEAKFQCDASDKRTIGLKTGESISTTCLQYGDFDIVAVNLFAFQNHWEFAFALNSDLPNSTFQKYPIEIRQRLIKSIIPICYPVQFPFVTDPFELLERLHKNHESF